MTAIDYWKTSPRPLRCQEHNCEFQAEVGNGQSGLDGGIYFCQFLILIETVMGIHSHLTCVDGLVVHQHFVLFLDLEVCDEREIGNAAVI